MWRIPNEQPLPPIRRYFFRVSVSSSFRIARAFWVPNFVSLKIFFDVIFLLQNLSQSHFKNLLFETIDRQFFTIHTNHYSNFPFHLYSLLHHFFSLARNPIDLGRSWACTHFTDWLSRHWLVSTHHRWTFYEVWGRSVVDIKPELSSFADYKKETT